MASLPPGDPQLVSMIVNHLKTQGLFDQFRRDCLADVDTKPAYLNLKQRVDNFVSNHLSNHTWSPQLNKNQLRNNIRQLVLQSGMLEQGVDRIVAQVVDPKVNLIFRPQVEKVVHQLLSPGTSSEEPAPPPPPPPPSTENNVDAVVPQQGSSSTPPSTTAPGVMSILDTITSLNLEVNVKAPEKECKPSDEDSERDAILAVEDDVKTEEEEDGDRAKPQSEESEAMADEPSDAADVKKEIDAEEVKVEDEEDEKKEEEPRSEGEAEEKAKVTPKTSGKHSEEKPEEDGCQAKQKAKERIKEEYSLEDSDLDGLSDITVSSVHTSDLSSFEGESDDDQPLSDSSSEGERPSDGVSSDKKETGEETGEEGRESKPRRKAYVHKPFLYSRYYSDSDDEVTVEERRRSAAKDKEERLLKRQQNRERMEEKRKQKAAQAEEQDQKKQKSSQSAGMETPRAKEARKERKVLEKKMALNRKRKLDSRNQGDATSKKKGETGETSKKTDVKSTPSRSLQQKPVKNPSESWPSDDRHGKTGVSEDSPDAKKLPDKNRTHSFILDLELGSQEALRQRSVGKFDRPSRKDRKERERAAASDDVVPKLKPKQEKKAEVPLSPPQKDGAPAKALSDDRSEKKPKGKNEKKSSGAKEQKSETDDASSAKRMRAQSVEKDKKDKTKEKDKFKAGKSDSKQPPRGDSSEERRPEATPPTADALTGKKKEKHSKDAPKRPKSHGEDRQGDKAKLKMDLKEKTKGEQAARTPIDGDKSPKRVKTTEKGKMADKSKLREEPKSPATLKVERKAHASDLRGKEKKKGVGGAGGKEQRRNADESGKKKADRKEKESRQEKKAGRVEKADEAAAHPALSPTPAPPAVPPEADALLTLMDVCASAMDARLHEAGDGERAAPLVTLRDADMKMKEAALALLSMDPDGAALPPGFMSHETKEEPEENRREDASEFSAPPLDDRWDSREKSGPDSTGADTLLRDDAKSQESPSREEEESITGKEMDANSQLTEEQELPTEEHAKVEENPAVAPCEMPTLPHVCTPPETTREDGDAEIEAGEAVATELELSCEVKNQEENCTAPIGEQKSPVTEATSATEVAQPESESSDVHEERKESEVCEKERGRGRRKRKLSSQNVAVVNESVEDQDGKEAMMEERQAPNVLDVKTPRRGRSSKALDEGEEPNQAGKKEQTPSRRGRPSSSKDEPALKKRRSSKTGEAQEGDQTLGNSTAVDASEGTSAETIDETETATPEETSEDAPGESGEDACPSEEAVQLKEEEPEEEKSQEEPSKDEEKPDEKEMSKDAKEEPVDVVGEDGATEKSEMMITEKSEMVTTESSEDTSNGEASKEEAAEDVHNEPAEDAREEPLKVQGEDQQNVDSPPASLSKDNEEIGGEKKADAVDDPQSAVPKKPARRGRPPKTATPSDGAEKKEKTEVARNDEDDNGGEKDEDGKEAKGRATTRLASRLEAERNKPSKPSTRASRQSGKDEPAARGARGRGSGAKGGRKAEPNLPSARSRGGQKSEEPPAKRAKR
ncbi:biorientation of chromosomes in cell division 1-like 1 isoform X2 [Stigmatopora argus]